MFFESGPIIEDIYPLTIVARRYGGFAIINAISEVDCVSSLQENEEWHYYPHDYMEKMWSYINYGIGDNVAEAFEDFKTRSKYKFI